MDSLIGIPAGRLALALLAILAAGSLVLSFLAARDRTSFRMAVRNLSRHRAQTALIVTGLMLATLLFSAFAASGLQTEVTAEGIRDGDAARRVIFLLLRGFMGLGLVVGICALGVIAARSVVERRQQIGMVRALGFQKGQVRLAFLIESSFLALLSIGAGVALASGFSVTLVDNIREGFPGMEYTVPWSALVLVILVGYGASLLTTYLPARRASKIYPTEALRYE